eukprot:CAMPEP_0170189614 /NCGR_PEP_ID=MMETSP0040_2-20121228/47279_1 /TAXON_ID=641309 /ORGANISM="Lotharella oceanica, Strain CCMP622" /LENGTH=32 /DNA_ID= /DNA_START= /DNA_END= /DNA_ORIENTATION=
MEILIETDALFGYVVEPEGRAGGYVVGEGPLS